VGLRGGFDTLLSFLLGGLEVPLEKALAICGGGGEVVHHPGVVRLFAVGATEPGRRIRLCLLGLTRHGRELRDEI